MTQEDLRDAMIWADEAKSQGEQEFSVRALKSIIRYLRRLESATPATVQAPETTTVCAYCGYGVGHDSNCSYWITKHPDPQPQAPDAPTCEHNTWTQSGQYTGALRRCLQCGERQRLRWVPESGSK